MIDCNSSFSEFNPSLLSVDANVSARLITLFILSIAVLKALSKLFCSDRELLIAVMIFAIFFSLSERALTGVSFSVLTCTNLEIKFS
ncbi:hypothetical protein [Ureaplasma zalophigenitalium]|uniref:Uncharacterized protein n=1 Tax=Ureaplasma zalophigenitalium TaxID=907723 RepID=A0ABT3BP92_9BACT|nr:hypothetical protein [Ureaplasma zalophigenitalium]MCV3754059.1 hypothetical protein [Ureaplasma zalophigenitalium]